MSLFDLPRDVLDTYLPDRGEPADFADFWNRTLAQARADGGEVSLTRFDAHLPPSTPIAGFGGQDVHAWWIHPAGPQPNAGWPVVVQFLGYGDGRGTSLDWLSWPAAGFATLVMDTRGQGARARRSGSLGDTSSSAPPARRGLPHQGHRRPARLPTGAYPPTPRWPSTSRTGSRGADPTRVAIQGTSQGGAIALAAAALADGVDAVVANVPFLCHPERAITVTDARTYSELLDYVRTRNGEVERAFTTLRYFDFDGMTTSAHATAPVLFSVTLMHEVCPPSTVNAAHNRSRGPEELVAHPWNEHEGGRDAQELRRIHWVQVRFGVRS